MRFPHTISTAMVSPRARLTAKTVEATIPGNPALMTTNLVVCQRVAPTLSDASRKSLLTLLNISINRLIFSYKNRLYLYHNGFILLL